MEKPWITNIQRYAIHDGKGIRTSVFFKGCPLRCRWCHNPETQSCRPQLIFYGERCVGCGACVEECPEKAISLRAGQIENGREKGPGQRGADRETAAVPTAVTDRELCTGCGVCVDACIKNARESSGRQWEIKELVKELCKDQPFFETSGGGVTLSGGEALSQNVNYITELARRLHDRGIQIAADTCGAVPWERFAAVLPYVDTFLYDIKLVDGEAHRRYTGRDNKEILENLERLAKAGADIWVRLPLIGGVNADEGHIRAVASWLKEKNIRPGRISLLPYHNTGSGKYVRLDTAYGGEEFVTPSQESLEEFREVLLAEGFEDVRIGG